MKMYTPMQHHKAQEPALGFFKKATVLSTWCFLAVVLSTIPSMGQLSTFIGRPATEATVVVTETMNAPLSVFVSGQGDLYYSDEGNQIWKVAAGATTRTHIAGNGSATSSGDGSLAISAGIDLPMGIYVDTEGHIFVAEGGGRIRKIDGGTRIITTIAGNGVAASSGDGGLAVNASVCFPSDVYVDNTGNIYFTEAGCNKVRKIDAETDVITTIAGSGSSANSGDGGAATSAAVHNPTGVTTDDEGNVYIATSGRIRKVAAGTNIITSIAGVGGAGFSGDGGLATNAQVNPLGIYLDKNGRALYLADRHPNNRIRKIDLTTNIITTVAGNGVLGHSGDGDVATNGMLAYPYDVCLDNKGHIFIADNWNYSIRKVTRVAQTITFAPIADKVFGEGNFTPSVTATSELPVALHSSNTTVATVNGTEVTIVGAGSAILTASQSGDASYSGTSVQRTLTVKASQSITFGTLAPKTFGDANFTLEATSSASLPVSYESSNGNVATISGSTVTITGGGTTTITAKQAGNQNYAAATDVAQILTVNKANQNITFGTLASKTFGDANFTLEATASSSLPVSYESSNGNVATISESTVTITGGGTTTITAKQPGNQNYTAATDVAQMLTVKASQSITFGPLIPKTFGDANFTLGATSSASLPVSYESSNGNVATISGSTVTITGGGTTTITAKQAGNQTYNAATDVPQTLTVNKANQTITFNPIPAKVGTDMPFVLNAQASSQLPVTYESSNTAVATVNNATVTIVGAGTTIITARQSGNTNYNGAPEITQELRVKLSQTISFGALSAKAIGDNPFLLTGTASSGLAITYQSSNTAVATLSGNMVTLVGAGSTTITARQPGDDSYGPASEVEQLLTVTKREQTISFPQVSNRVFGNTPFTLNATASSGLSITYTSTNANVATIEGNTVTIQGAGESIITASQAGNDTYSPTVSEQMLVVAKAPQSITFPALENKFNSASPFAITASTSSGLDVSLQVVAGPASLSGNMLTLTGDVGTVTIQAQQSGNTNYEAAVPVIQIFEVMEDPVLGISDEINLEHDVNIYPQPSTGLMTVRTKEMVMQCIEVMDLQGRRVVNDPSVNQYEWVINLPTSSKGIYLLKITDTAGKVVVKRIILSAGQ